MTERFMENMYCLLKEKKISIGELEKEIGVSVGYFSRLRKNKSDIYLAKALAISKLLGVPIDDLCNKSYKKEQYIRKIAELNREIDRLAKECEMNCGRGNEDAE